MGTRETSLNILNLNIETICVQLDHECPRRVHYSQDVCEFVSRISECNVEESNKGGSRFFFKEEILKMNPALWDLAEFVLYRGGPFRSVATTGQWCYNVRAYHRFLSSYVRTLTRQRTYVIVQGISFPNWYLGGRGTPFFWHLEDSNLFR